MIHILSKQDKIVYTAAMYVQLFRERLSYKREKRLRDTEFRKLFWVMMVFTVAWVNLKVFSVVEGNSTNTCIRSFSFLVAESP